MKVPPGAPLTTRVLKRRFLNKASPVSFSADDVVMKRKQSDRVVVVTGTPGTGKTAVAKRLSSKLKSRLISLSKLALQGKLISSYDSERRTSIVDARRVARVISRIIHASEGNLVLEGHYVNGVVPRQVRVAFVLRCHPFELRERLRRKGYSERKIRENVEAEVLDICLAEAIGWFRKGRVSELDTTGKSIRETVEEALAILSGKKPIAPSTVNWVRELREEGKLLDILVGEN